MTHKMIKETFNNHKNIPEPITHRILHKIHLPCASCALVILVILRLKTITKSIFRLIKKINEYIFVYFFDQTERYRLK